MTSWVIWLVMYPWLSGPKAMSQGFEPSPVGMTCSVAFVWRFTT